MSLIFLIAGAILFYTERIEVGTIQAKGKHVKVAGVLLALPAIVSLLLLQIFIPFALGRNTAAAETLAGLVSVLEIIGLMAVVAIAYVLIADPPGAPTLPGVLGEIQAEARKANGQQPTAPKSQTGKVINIPTTKAPARPRINLKRDNFPNVMSLKEAARYLQTTEEEILKMIDEGKLTAARDNFNYKIAKSQLDELV